MISEMNFFAKAAVENVFFSSDSCDLLIEDDRGTSCTRNSLFLFDDEVDMDNEVSVNRQNCLHSPRTLQFVLLRALPERAALLTMSFTSRCGPRTTWPR